jgi:hypothetical protein
VYRSWKLFRTPGILLWGIHLGFVALRRTRIITENTSLSRTLWLSTIKHHARASNLFTMESSKEKDMRQPDLIIPYQEPAAKGDNVEFQSTISSTLPMAAIFMRNKYVGWAAVVFSIQSWLGESEETKKSSSTPGYFNVGMSVVSLLVTYLPLFLPPPGVKTGSPTGAPAPLPV